MDTYYRNTHLKLLGTSFLSFLSSYLIFRYFGMNKKGVLLSFLSLLLPNRLVELKFRGTRTLLYTRDHVITYT